MKKEWFHVITFVVLITVAFLGVLIWISSGSEVSYGAQIESFEVSSDGKTSYVSLVADTNLEGVAGIRFLFKDLENRTHIYEARKGLVNDTEGHRYLINARDLGLEDFGEISSVEVVLVYKPRFEGSRRINPESPASESKQKTIVSSGSSDGESRGKGGTHNNYFYSPDVPKEEVEVPVCTNECDFSGSYCDYNLPYDCVVGLDGCLDKVEYDECLPGFYCEAGACIEGCRDECNVLGENFCYAGSIYSCGEGEDGCNERVLNQTCDIGKICVNSGCRDESVSNTLIYSDSFEDGNYNETDESTGDNIVWEEVSRGVSVIGGSLGLSSEGGFAVNDQILSGEGFTVEWDLGIIWSRGSKFVFYYSDSDNYYYVGFNGAYGVYRVMDGVTERLDDGLYSKLFSLAHSSFSESRYKVYFDNDGDQINIWVDRDGYENGIDYEMKIVDDNPRAVSKFVSGNFGFADSLEEVRASSWVLVDNVKVYLGLKENERLNPLRDYYVSNSGDDEGLGTLDNPFKTIAKAASVVQAGETVYIMPGNYYEGDIVSSYSGTDGAPVTYKAFDENDKPRISGAVRIPSGSWQVDSGSVYKTVINWSPSAIYIDDVPLFNAQDPNQENPEDQMEMAYFLNVSNELNPRLGVESHYDFYDPYFEGKPDNYWKGAYVTIHDSYTNAMGSYEVLESSGNKVTTRFMRWADYGSSVGKDRFAIRGKQVLDKPGEYYLDKGSLDVLSWSEEGDKLRVRVKMTSGVGNVTGVRFSVYNSTWYSEITNKSLLKKGDEAEFLVNLGNSKDVKDVYATIDSVDAYELYVNVPEGRNPSEIELTKYGSMMKLGSGYHENYIFDGLEIYHYLGSGLGFSVSYGSTLNSIVKNCDIHNNLNGVTCNYHCNGLKVMDSKLHNNYGQGVSFSGGRDYLVEGCEVYENLDNGIWMGGQSGAGRCGSEVYVVEDAIIRNNYVYNQSSARTHPDGIQLYRVKNIVVDSNYLVQDGHQNTWFSLNGPIWFRNNIVIGGPVGINSANESYVYNNVFYKSTARFDSWQGVCEGIYDTRIGILKNNVFIDSTYTRPPEYLWKNMHVDNNFISIVDQGYGGWLTNLEGNLGSNIFDMDANRSEEDDLMEYFEDLTTFRLRSGSELIDKGVFEENSPLVDRDGSRRWQGVAVDIGPTESSNSFSYQDCFDGRKEGNEEGKDCGGICVQDFDLDGQFVGQCSGNNDCNDSNPLIHSGAEEILDGIDNNCDGVLHQDVEVDSDGDGFLDWQDNCPFVSNVGQEDFDLDLIGDACDSKTTYFEGFSERSTGSGDLGSRKTGNGFSWENVSGGMKVILGSLGKRMQVVGLIIGDRNFGEMNFSVDVWKAWGNDAGIVLDYIDSENYYLFCVSNTCSGLVTGCDSYSAGGLYRVREGVCNIVGSNSSLRIPHSSNSRKDSYNFVLNEEPDGFHLNVSRRGPEDFANFEFVDSSPLNLLGKIGFYQSYQQYNVIWLDNISVEVDGVAFSGESSSAGSVATGHAIADTQGLISKILEFFNNLI